MSEAKHTAGPWRTFNGTDVYPDDGDTAAMKHIADCSMAGSIGGDEQNANARLIAAAPDLLDALQHLSDVYEHIWVQLSDGEMAIVKGAWEVAERAIAKTRAKP